MAHEMIHEVLAFFVSQLEQQVEEDPNGFKKYLMKPSIAESCICRLREFASAHNIESRSMERLNLNFIYSFIQAKYCDVIDEKLGFGI